MGNKTRKNVSLQAAVTGQINVMQRMPHTTTLQQTNHSSGKITIFIVVNNSINILHFIDYYDLTNIC